MIKHMFILICFVAAGMAAADSTETHSVGYELVRSQVDAADHDPNSVERTWAFVQEHYAGLMWVPKRDILRTASATRPVTHANYIELMFTFNDASASSTVVILGMRDPTDNPLITPLEPVCSYALTAGAQITGETTPRYFADLAGEAVYNYWSVSVVDGGGDDGVLKLHWDGKGYWGWLILFPTINAGDNVSVYGTYY